MSFKQDSYSAQTSVFKKKIVKQEKIMKRDARNFTRKNHAEGCRLPMPRMHKPGWQGNHTSPKRLLNSSTTLIIIISDSVTATLRRYKRVWKNYFEDAVNLGIGDERYEKYFVESVTYFFATYSIFYNHALCHQ